jgi:hypothetical protein
MAFLVVLKIAEMTRYDISKFVQSSCTGWLGVMQVGDELGRKEWVRHIGKLWEIVDNQNCGIILDQSELGSVIFQETACFLWLILKIRPYNMLSQSAKIKQTVCYITLIHVTSYTYSHSLYSRISP